MAIGKTLYPKQKNKILSNFGFTCNFVNSSPTFVGFFVFEKLGRFGYEALSDGNLYQ